MASNWNGAGQAAPPRGTGMLLALGILLIIGGLLAILLPGATALAATIIAGWVLLLIGVAGIVMGVRTRRDHGRVSDILLGALSVVAGLVLIFDPLRGALSLTLVLSIWLLVRGIMELIGASRSNGGGRTLLIVAGLVDLLLAGLLFFNYPFPAVQMAGLFVGISLLFRGVTTTMAAVALRKL
ncbi:uncharacterized membrane protein HdeD (DUF308 family) [Sphingomonas jejuensis]|uniref:Uncharacterized membrane protein HdeD (DUF308 family) n=1 Tax=Sphingomonas jejuensis TaxID=904715 RepID=A0ABX0XKZ9_9SPHN|nr:DUF308 domain-containing protein [Sphingomonas jejuensis]NJC33467.1 uncharacterized membrane protein HdeD (DUF308 family) [Sphingomonas jejuensis]